MELEFILDMIEKEVQSASIDSWVAFENIEVRTVVGCCGTLCSYVFTIDIIVAWAIALKWLENIMQTMR